MAVKKNDNKHVYSFNPNRRDTCSERSIVGGLLIGTKLGLRSGALKIYSRQISFSLFHLLT